MWEEIFLADDVRPTQCAQRSASSIPDEEKLILKDEKRKRTGQTFDRKHNRASYSLRLGMTDGLSLETGWHGADLRRFPVDSQERGHDLFWQANR